MYFPKHFFLPALLYSEAVAFRQCVRSRVGVVSTNAPSIAPALAFDIGNGWEAISEAGRQSVGALYDHFASEITQSDRTMAVETLTYFLNTALIEAGLYPDLGPPAPRGLSLEALAEELADFAWGYLTAPRD